MAYFHARSYSPFLFSFLSSILLLAVFSFCKCSGRVCLSDLGPPCILFSNPFFSSSSSSLLPFPEKCLRVCVCWVVDDAKMLVFLFLFFFICVQEFWNGRRAAISSPESEVGLPRKQARLDDSSPSHINHIVEQVCLERVFVLSRSSDKSRSMSISKNS